MAESIINPTTMSGLTNGINWVKFIDGTMIQYAKSQVTTTYNATKNPYAYGGDLVINFPILFTSSPCITTAVSEGAAWWNSNANNPQVNTFVLSLAGDQTATRDVFWIAIGRWK